MENLVQFIQSEIESSTVIIVQKEEALISSGLLDSIALVDLAVALESYSKVHIPFTDVNEENFDSIEKIIVYLNAKNNS